MSSSFETGAEYPETAGHHMEGLYIFDLQVQALEYLIRFARITFYFLVDTFELE